MSEEGKESPEVEEAESAEDIAAADIDEPSAEELAMRELAEHNALADVFDDVREQSANGCLAEPSRWPEIGLVPEHMTAEDFEMFVYEWLESYQVEHASEIEAERAAERAEAVSVRSAERAVGVPPKIPNRRLAQIEADRAEGKRTISGESDEKAVAPALSESETDAETQQEENADGASLPLASLPPRPSSSASTPEPDGQPAEDDSSPFFGLSIPEGFKLEQIEGEWVLVRDENAVPVRRDIRCNRIKSLVGMYSYYLYDETLMTDSYAHWAFLAAEDNPAVTFAECVREDSRVYPRPYAAECLKNPPFCMNDEQIGEAWRTVRDSGNYPDIQRTEASNGDVYYYSTDYLSPDYAASLAEYDAVERPASV